MPITLRPAQRADIPGLEILIPLSARTLQVAYYSPDQIEGALGTVFGVDSQLIDDGTYFTAVTEDRIVGAGGWSKRRTLYGSDRAKKSADLMLDPAREPARIRAFFVHPDFTRRGLGRQLMVKSEEAALRAGFRSFATVATLAGEPLYATFGYVVVERYELTLANNLKLPVVHMAKTPAPGVS